MSRPKLSCDWERPRCTRLATQRVQATNGTQFHTSQYCDGHFQLILIMPLPNGWEIPWPVITTPKSPTNQLT